MRNFIDGKWSMPATVDGTLLRHNPADLNHLLFELHWSVGAVDAAVEAARRAQKAWDRLGFEGRKTILLRFADELTARKEDIARRIAEQAGKPLWEAMTEAAALPEKIRIMTGEGARYTADVHPEGLAGGSFRHRPLGVAAVLGPFNFPLHLPNGHIIPALFHGNTVVVKPSELTSDCFVPYAEAAQAAGIPDGVLNLVHGPGPVGAALASHTDVDAVMFTGSYDTGLRIKRATLEHHWKLLALEMGGKNTSIVLEDADLTQAAHDIAFASYMTAGQRCSATSRIVVAAPVFDDFVDAFRDVSRRVTVGHTTQETAFMGPLINETAFQRFLAAQEQTEGGRLENLLPGGRTRDDLHGFYVAPALWHAHELDERGPHQSEEIFGPDVVLYRASSDAEILRIANGTPYGLACSVYGQDEARFEELGWDLEVGILNWNRSTCGASSRLPFGGVKKSGNHRASAVHAGLYCGYPQAQLRVGPGFDEATLNQKPWSLLSPAKSSS